MHIFLLSLQILAMDLCPVLLALIIHYCFNKFTFLKNLNKWYKQIIIGILFAALCIVSYYIAVPIHVSNDKVTFVGNGTVLPIVACLVFGWQSGIITAIIGALYRGLAFTDYLRISVVISLLVSALVGTLVRVFLYKDKRTKWYNAALTSAFVETINFLMIFAFSNDITEAFNVLSRIDAACILGAFLTLSLTIILINLIDRKVFKINIHKRKRSQSISTKVQHRLFIVTFLTLIVVSFSTYFINSRRAEEDVKEQLKLTDDNIQARLELKYTVNYYEKEKEGGTMTQEYYTLCANQTISEKGYAIIVADNNSDGTPIVDASYTYYRGDIISTNYFLADPSQAVGSQFKFDDNSNAFNRNSSDYSDDTNTNLLDVTINKINYYCAIYKENAYPTLGGDKHINFCVICLANCDEVDASVGVSLKITMYTEILAFLFLFAVINLLINRLIVKKISQINGSLDKITNGDLNEVVKAKGSKEIEKLSSRINLTVDSLKLYAKKAELKISEDLELARKIQTTSVPTLFPLVARYEIYATMHTAKEVGGDFYDYITIDNSHVMFLVADVSGKGIPAALFMMRAKTLIKSLVMASISLEEVVRRANDDLCDDNVAGLFVTMWIGILDTSNGVVTYVNCGHCAPLIRINNKYSYLKSRSNFVLGTIPGFTYKSDTITLNPNDILLLYTDGVTEATDKNLELYGENRLIEFVKTNAIKAFDCHQMLDFIIEEVSRYQKDVDQADDITLLVMKYLGDVSDSSSRELILRNKEEDVVAAINFVKTFMHKNGAKDTDIAKMSSAIDEIFTNIVKYAYNKKVGNIKLHVSLEDKTIKVMLIDRGIRFNPTIYETINDEKMGLKIARRCVDNMTYQRVNDENILILEKEI